MKKKGMLWAHLYPLLLFGIIVLSLLFLVTESTGLYSAIVAAKDDAGASRATLAYLTVHLRAADATGGVALGQGPEGPVLLLRDTAGDALYETRVYLYEGKLCEEYAAADAPLSPESAVPIAETDIFAVEQTAPGLLTVTTRQGSARVALRCTREVDGDA